MALAVDGNLGHNVASMPRITVPVAAGNLQWLCLRTKRGNWIGVCDPLKLTIQSATWAELMEDIADALNSMLIDLIKSGELNRFMQDHGWKLLGEIPRDPHREDVRFDVPFLSSMMGAH